MKNRIRAAVLALALALGVGVAAAGPASAHWTSYCGHGTYRTTLYTTAYWTSYDDARGHWHLYRSYLNIPPFGWHLDDKICGPSGGGGGGGW